MKPLFIALKSAYYEAFADGSKTIEYRKYGPRWNERTCTVGRRVTLSKGYGKQNRLSGVITGCKCKYVDSQDWIDCYGKPGLAACISISVEKE